MRPQDYGLAKSKWDQYQRFIEDPELTSHVPHTECLDKEKLAVFLAQYPFVYLKPITGGKGLGIMKVSRSPKGFRLQTNIKTTEYPGIEQLYEKGLSTTEKKSYIIQQGISLVTLKGRPIDFRILLMKPRLKWNFMGVMGRWAAPNKIVTNYSRGGMAVTLEKAIDATSRTFRLDYIVTLKKLKQLGFYMAHYYFNYATKLGLDVGIDQEKKIWILEGNTIPGFNLFRYHENPELYNKIWAWQRYILNRHNKRKGPPST